MNLSETEKRVLTSLHLRGCTGSMGSMNSKARLNLLNSLVERGLLNDKCEVTKVAIEAIRPQYLKEMDLIDLGIHS